jgi:hypothetical protein
VIFRDWLPALRRAFLTPTTKQQEAYGRLLHNLAAACLIADTSILFTENPFGVRHIIALLVIGVLCFLMGALLCEGD